LITRQRGWSGRGARWTIGWILLLSLTGLGLQLLPFSAFNQHALLVHTLVGLAFLPPAAAYLARHVAAYLHFPLTHVKWSGWTSLAVLVVCIGSGLVLTWQAAAGRRIGPDWRSAHLISTYALIPLLGAHLAWVWTRDAVRRRAGEEVARPARATARTSAVLGALGVIASAVLAVVLRPLELRHEFPVDYDHAPYEGAGPFSPSLATTEHGGALDSRTLAGSSSCGTAGCHEEIYREWLPSAHRYASMDAGFQAIQSVMASQNGPVSTRYCGGCHDPISLFSGTKNIGVANLTELSGYQEGISCLACHAIRETDVAGNANYVMTAPPRYVWEGRTGWLAAFLRDFSLRAYPDFHVASLSRRMFKTPEFCAACHKQFIDEEVNRVGWVQLQNQYDNWRASRWHDPDDPSRTLECRECHMPLVDSADPAAGDTMDANRGASDGKHRSHRFLGANQYIPVLMKLEGGEEHARLTERWLRGEIEVPEIADRWREGAAVPLALEVPEEVGLSEELALRVHIVNNKVGHDFPTGPLDIIQAWIEVEVRDATGALVFSSGTVDERGKIDPGSFLFKAEPVDRYGNLIDRHNLWEMVGVRFKRSLFPGAEEVASYDFVCSGTALEQPAPALEVAETWTVADEITGPLEVRARLLYRKFDQFLLDYAFGADSGLTAPVAELARAEASVRLRPRGR